MIDRLRRLSRSRIVAGLGGAVGALVIGGATLAFASIPDGGGVVRACYKTAGGAVRVIDTGAGARCATSERALAWPVTPRRTRLHFSTIASTVPPADFTYKLGRTVGPVTKVRANTVLRLTWVGQVALADNPGVCNFQLRVDGKTDDGSSSTAPTGATGGAANAAMVDAADVVGDALPVGVTTWFAGLAAGSHTVQIWVRGFGTTPSPPTCIDNAGGYGQDVFVEETS